MVNNFQFAGPAYWQLWKLGQGGVSVVDWGLQGMAMEKPVFCADIAGLLPAGALQRAEVGALKTKSGCSTH